MLSVSTNVIVTSFLLVLRWLVSFDPYLFSYPFALKMIKSCIQLKLIYYYLLSLTASMINIPLLPK